MSSIAFIAIGDPHFKVNNVRECEEATIKIINKIKDVKPDIIVVMGDILDRHESIHVTPLKNATLFLENLTKLGKTYILIGNHDRPNNSNFLTDDHPFIALKQWSNCTIVDKVMVDYIKGEKFTFVPYVPPGRFAEALATARDPNESITEELTKLEINENISPVDKLYAVKDVRAIFCHQEMYSCRMGSIISTAGDVWPATAPLVISGHIHDYQELGNIIYVGSMLQHAFGDSDSKSISKFIFKSNSWEHERIDLNLIKKKIVHLRCSEVSTYQPPPNSLIKLVITGTWDETKSISRIARIRELTRMGVKISYCHLPITNNPEESSEESIDRKLIPKKEIPYLERLHEDVKDYPRQVTWLDKLFGSIKNPKILS